MNQVVAAAQSSDELRGVVEALALIELRLDRLERAAENAFHGGRDVIGVLTDTVDRKIAAAQSRGLDVDERLANLTRAAEHLSSNEAIALLDSTFSRLDRIQRVLESGLLDPAAVTIVSKAGRALAEAAAAPRHGVGPLGLLGALGEKDVRAAIGLLLAFARRMGRSLQRDASAAELPPVTSLAPASPPGGPR